MTEAMLDLKCGCGAVFQRPEKYKRWNDENPNVMFRWKLQYCDPCYKERTKQALNKLPEVLNKLVQP